MRTNFHAGFVPVFNAAGEAGAGAAPAVAPASPQPAAGASPSGAPAAAPPASGAPAGAPAVPAPGQAAPDYWPDGLDQKYKGADAKSTLDNLAKDLKGYRDRDAKNLVPDKPEGYLDFTKVQDFKIDPQNQPHFDNLKNDPVYAAIAKQAHADGVGQRQMLNMYQAALNSMSEAGLMEPLLDATAELAALVPEGARNLPQSEQDAAVQKRLGENYAFLDLAVQNRGLPKHVAKHMELSLGDSALGHQGLEWMRGQLQGGGAPPMNVGLPGQADTRESIRTEQARIDALPIGKERTTAEAALDERRKRMPPVT